MIFVFAYMVSVAIYMYRFQIKRPHLSEKKSIRGGGLLFGRSATKTIYRNSRLFHA